MRSTNDAVSPVVAAGLLVLIGVTAWATWQTNALPGHLRDEELLMYESDIALIDGFHQDLLLPAEAAHVTLRTTPARVFGQSANGFTPNVAIAGDTNWHLNLPSGLWGTSTALYDNGFTTAPTYATEGDIGEVSRIHALVVSANLQPPLGWTLSLQATSPPFERLHVDFDPNAVACGGDHLFSIFTVASASTTTHTERCVVGAMTVSNLDLMPYVDVFDLSRNPVLEFTGFSSGGSTSTVAMLWQDDADRWRHVGGGSTTSADVEVESASLQLDLGFGALPRAALQMEYGGVVSSSSAGDVIVRDSGLRLTPASVGQPKHQASWDLAVLNVTREGTGASISSEYLGTRLRMYEAGNATITLQGDHSAAWINHFRDENALWWIDPVSRYTDGNGDAVLSLNPGPGWHIIINEHHHRITIR